MLMVRAKRPATRPLRGWAISVLHEAGAIKECEEHIWMQEATALPGNEAALRVAIDEVIPPSLAEAGVEGFPPIFDCAVNSFQYERCGVVHEDVDDVYFDAERHKVTVRRNHLWRAR